MPTLKEHEEYSLKKYGKSFTELHKWMDFPVKAYGNQHRKFRHDSEKTPKEAKLLFGKNANHVCLDHIIMDLTNEIKIKNKKSGSKLYSIRIGEPLRTQLDEYCLLTQDIKAPIIREFIKEGLINRAYIGMLKRWQENRENKLPLHEHAMALLVNKETCCEKCGLPQKMGALSIYHINGNIRNQNPENIVFLCNSCLTSLRESIQKYNPKEKFAAWFFY